MKLSKQQKLEAYTYCLLMALSRYKRMDIWISDILQDWLMERNFPLTTTFPELDPQYYWWKSNKEYIKEIERAIELTEKLPG